MARNVRADISGSMARPGWSFVGVCLLLTTLTLAAACASTGATPKPFPTPSPPEHRDRIVTPGATADVDALLQDALKLRGVPYRNGGSDPNGFDCSGFTQWVFAKSGIKLPREVATQFDVGRPVDLKRAAPGDLIFFATTARGPSHVGVVIGRDQFIHAPSSRGVVRIESYTMTYWADRFVGVRRVVTPVGE